MSGTTPDVGATVMLWTSGTTSVTQVGSSATTDANGSFTVHYDCPTTANPYLYATAAGGNAGSGGANSHISMIAPLGLCGSSTPTSIIINELTSAAAAYAFGGLAPAAGTTPVALQGNVTGLGNAYNMFTRLASATSGTFSTSGREHNTSNVQAQLSSVANAMAACNSSNNVSATSAVCAELFACASANATYANHACSGGTSPTTSDTLSAALAVVQNAGLVPAAGISDVASASAAYPNALTAVPNDWSLGLSYAVSRTFGPLALDQFGNVWFLSQNPSNTTSLAVIELDPTGSVLSGANGFTGGGVGAIDSTDTTNLAIDTLGNVWVGGNSGHGIAEINDLGAAVAPANGWPAGGGPNQTAGVAIDSSNNAWFASGNASSVFELNHMGNNLSGTNGYQASICDCNGIVADNATNVWLIDAGAGLAKLSSAGVQGTRYAPTATTTPYFQAIAADSSGNFWIADKNNQGVWQFTTATTSFGPTFFNNVPGLGTIPKSIAVDGANHKWIANAYHNTGSVSSITELDSTGAVNLSPSSGFGANTLAGAYTVAIDQSGNVWVSDGGAYITQFLGAGAPTKNPIVTAVTSGFAP